MERALPDCNHPEGGFPHPPTAFRGPGPSLSTPSGRGAFSTCEQGFAFAAQRAVAEEEVEAARKARGQGLEAQTQMAELVREDFQDQEFVGAAIGKARSERA